MSTDAGRLIVALDVPDPFQAGDLVGKLGPLGVSFKIGLELFMGSSPSVVTALSSAHNLFLDLKFHDIPNTVAAAVRAAASMGVWMLNVHAEGGREMMTAARKAVDESEKKPLLIAVTVLTSMDDQLIAETGSRVRVTEKVKILARLAADCGFDGVVCSPLEIETVKKEVSPRFLTVTPGIRPQGEARGDQARVASPADVILAGGDYLVVGRPISAAANPVRAARKILFEMGVVT